MSNPGLITRMWPRFCAYWQVYSCGNHGDALRVPSLDGAAVGADEAGDCGPAVEVALGGG